MERHELSLVVLVSLALLLPGLWTFSLIDPWETHYGEVARRMLQDRDWVHLHWHDEGFRSKPVLTFWLIAASFRAFGVADGGGYSGELVQSDLVVFAARLPFLLFGALGLVTTWWMLRRLAGRRVAWLALAIIATCPLYALVARQAITDMPLVGALMGAVACFAMAIHEGQAALAPLARRGRLGLDARHVLLACVGALVLGQAVYYLLYFHGSPRLAAGVRVWQPGLLLAGGMTIAFAALAVWALRLQPVRTRGQVWMAWFYLLMGVSMLGKGPPGVAVAGAICLFYLVMTGRWRLLARLEIPRGLLIAALVAAPWHLAMWFKDGVPWAREYFIHNMLKRVAEGVHGERGSFDFYSSVLGVGMWPWTALLPAALVAVIGQRQTGGREAQVRLLVGIWAMVSVTLFAVTKTKFHHYILPAVPALAILVAFWIDDVLRGRGGRVALAALLGAALSLLVTRDLLGEPKQLIELFVYRYNRPWPDGPPWSVDVSGPIAAAGLAAAAALLALALPWRRARAAGVAGLLASALGFSLWAATDYMAEAAPHWGQRDLIRTYYRQRQIHGLEIQYWSLRDLADEWAGGPPDVEVRSALPDGFRVGLPMTVRLRVPRADSLPGAGSGSVRGQPGRVPGAGVPGDQVELRGQVATVGDDRFTIAVPAAERARLRDLIEAGRARERGRARRPWRGVDADRLIAWQLYWRGENFWTGDELGGPTDDTRTAFRQVDNKAFLAYLGAPGRKGRTYFLVTEAGRVAGLKKLLPTERARETLQPVDTSSNKFTLVRFEL